MNSYLEYLFAKKLLDINTKNLTESNKLKLANRINKFLFEAAQDWVTITLPSIGIAYAVGATDSKPFINDIWTKIDAAIEANPKAKALKTANNLAVQQLEIYAGSSNNYNGTPTQYDTSNNSADYPKWFGSYGENGAGKGDVSDFDLADLKARSVTKTFTNQTMLSGYKSNLALAEKRAADLATNIKSLMSTNGITIPDPTKGQGYEEILKGGVVDTGGVLDANRDTGFYKNPGQSALIIITLSGKEDIIKFPVTKEELKAGLVNKTILWGNYGGFSGYGVVDPLTAWELKYLPGEGQGKNTSVEPIVRWQFDYNAKNQLIKVTQIPDPGEKGIPAAVKLAFPAKEYIINPPGKAQLQTKVPFVYELLVAAGVYNRFFDAVP
jgi:hypothetical protein